MRARSSTCAAGSTRSSPLHTGKSVEEVKTDTERDYFMSSAEAQEYGIIDRVITEH